MLTAEATDLIAATHVDNGPRPLSEYENAGPFVYYIQCGSFVKIGTSINPESRVEQLRRGGKALRPTIWVGEPRLIAYELGNVRLERTRQAEYARLRDQGEWFFLDHDLAEHVEDIRLQQALTEIRLHIEHYNAGVTSKGWPARDINAAELHRQWLREHPGIDLEWIDAL